MKIAIVGATGLVGSKMIQILEERNFPVTELIPVASERSQGKILNFKNRKYSICTLSQAVEKQPHIAIFSAGSDISKEWAPKFAEIGCKVIDNSSYWRMDSTKKLIIPEINAEELTAEDMIIANPNCSTIQMLVALAPLHREFTIERIVVSTYQSITGTGQKAIGQMRAERAGEEGEQVYPYQIDQNLIPHIDTFLENGYTKEEMKMVNETHKILDQKIEVSPTTVRVPVMGGHSESINIQFQKPYKNIEQIREILKGAKGVTLQDDPTNNIYPMPLFAEGKDDVFVGRIREDKSAPHAINIWVVSDNLRKGAATNTIQIAEYLIANNLCNTK